MALTDEEKVEALRDATTSYFNSLNTYSNWETFVNLVTKQKVQTFLCTALDQIAANYDSAATSFSTKADGVEALSDDISNL